MKEGERREGERERGRELTSVDAHANTEAIEDYAVLVVSEERGGPVHAQQRIVPLRIHQLLLYILHPECQLII